APSGTRFAWNCPRASRPASFCSSMASSTGSSTARTCGRSWRGSLITVNINRTTTVGFLSSLKNLFKSKPKSLLPIIDVKQRFELLGPTGQGSMSKVWRARDHHLGRIVCVKLLDKEKTAKFDARFPGLKRPSEGAICVSLRHPNIVQTYEHGLTK